MGFQCDQNLKPYKKTDSMILQNFKTVEDLIADESFLNYYFQKNEDDVLDWEDWQAENPDREILVQEAFLVVDRLSLKFDETQIKDRLKSLQLRLNEREVQTPINKINIPIRSLMKIAATVTLLVAVGLYFFSKKEANTVHKGSYGEGGIALTTQSVENKSIAKVSVYELSDGSFVRLNTSSSIRLASDFGKQSRDIFLEGEAYFEVAKDASKPFRVHAGQSVTTAIGTAFTVKAINNEPVKVLLVEGKVAVKSTDKNSRVVELTQGQQIQIHNQTLLTVENINDVTLATRWKDGYVLTFRNNNFSDVIKVLSDNYNTPIAGYEQLPLTDAKITAEFDKSTPLSAVMEALAFTNGFNFSIQRDTVFISNK